MHTSSASWLCIILHAGITQFSTQGYIAEMRYINGDSGDLPNAKIFPLRDGETSTCDLLLRFEPAFQAEVRISQLLMGYALLPAPLGLSHQSTFSSEISYT